MIEFSASRRLVDATAWCVAIRHSSVPRSIRSWLLAVITPKVVEDLLEGTVERTSRAPPRQSEAFTFLGFRSYDPQLQPLLHVVQLASSVSDTHNAIYDEAALVGSAS